MTDCSVSIDLHCMCKRCLLAFHVKGEAGPSVYEALSNPFQCVRCGEEVTWDSEQDPTVFYRMVLPEEFYRIVHRLESIGECPDIMTVAALLTTYSVEEVNTNGPAIKSMKLNSGHTIEFGISRWGPVPIRVTRSGE